MKSIPSLKVVRLVNGEELIGNVSPRGNEDDIQIYRPFKVIHIPNPQDGSATILVVKMTILSDDEWVTFSRLHVLNIMEPNEDAVGYYNISLKKQLEEWMNEEFPKMNALKNFKEIENSAIEPEVPEDEEELDENAGDGHPCRPRSKKKQIN